MKTIQFNPNTTKQQHKNKWIILSFFLTCLFMCQLSAQTSTNANSISVKGIVYDENGALPNVSIILKDSRTGTMTNTKGKFTFPENIEKGAILSISHLGYKTQNTTISEASKYLNINLKLDALDTVLIAPNSDKIYRTKR